MNQNMDSEERNKGIHTMKNINPKPTRCKALKQANWRQVDRNMRYPP